MQNEPIDMAIWLQSARAKFALAPYEVEELSERHPDYRIRGIPIPRPREDWSYAAASEFVDVNIVVYAALAFLVSKLLEGFLKDAGSDLYKYVKKFLPNRKDNVAPDEDSFVDLLASLMARNDSLSYSLGQKICLAAQLNDEYVFIIIRIDTHELLELTEYETLRDQNLKKLNTVDRDSPDYDLALREFADQAKPLVRRLLKAKLAVLAENWGKIARDIEHFQIGNKRGIARSESGFHVIRETHDLDGKIKWVIEAYGDYGDNSIWRR